MPQNSVCENRRGIKTAYCTIATNLQHNKIYQLMSVRRILSTTHMSISNDSLKIYYRVGMGGGGGIISMAKAQFLKIIKSFTNAR